MDLFAFKDTVFLLYKTIIDGLESRGIFVDYCDVFISCLGSQKFKSSHIFGK